MKKKYNTKTRRVLNRVNKILIKNKKQNCYILFIYFSDETMKKTSKTTRHKYIITALNSLSCDYIAIENQNKDKTREHYRALISTEYKKLMNHLTYKWLSTKGALRHNYIDSTQKEYKKIYKLTAKLSGLTKNTLNEITNKIVIYSDENKPNKLNEIRAKIKDYNSLIYFNKTKGKPIKEIESQRDKVIQKLRDALRERLINISKLFNTKKGAKSQYEIALASCDNTFKTKDEYKNERIIKNDIEKLKQTERANRLISDKEYHEISKLKNKTYEQQLLLFYYEIDKNKDESNRLKSFKIKIEQIKEFTAHPITKARYIELFTKLNKDYKSLTEQEQHELYLYEVIKPYTSTIIQDEITQKIHNETDKLSGVL